jgi:PAS domain S-box-containing protein
MGKHTHTEPVGPVLGSLTFLIVAVAVFVSSFALDAKSNRFTSILLPFLFLSIVAAGVFRLIYWRIAVRRRIIAEADAYSRERELTSIFEHALDGILILDNGSACIDANPAACRLLDVAAVELIGRSFGDFHADRAEFVHHWKSFLSTGYQRGETRLLSRDRQSVFVEYTATANYVPGRHVLILCDNTRQKRAESSLQNIEKLFRQMADHIQEVFWLMDAQSKKLIYVNRAFETVTGGLVPPSRTIHSLTKKSFTLTIVSPSSLSWPTVLRAVSSTKNFGSCERTAAYGGSGAAPSPCETRVNRPDGSSEPLSM